MYDLKVDPHTHTIFTKHAYSTIAENVAHAAAKGLAAIGMTDHFGLHLPWFQPARLYEMENHIKPRNLPQVMDGVRVFNGVEIDIISHDGALAGSEISAGGYMGFDTLADYLLATKEVIIAAVHQFAGFRKGGAAKNTQMYINVLARPNVDILGHPTRCALEFDWLAVVRAAAAHGKMIEINTETLRSRPEQWGVNATLAELCAKEGVSIVVGSDAHVCYNVGEFGAAPKLLEEIGFPKELIASRSLAAFEDALKTARSAS